MGTREKLAATALDCMQAIFSAVSSMEACLRADRALWSEAVAKQRRYAFFMFLAAAVALVLAVTAVNDWLRAGNCFTLAIALVFFYRHLRDVEAHSFTLFLMHLKVRLSLWRMRRALRTIAERDKQ